MVTQAYKLLSTTCGQENYQTMSKELENWCYPRPQFEIVDDVLYHVESDKTLRIIPTVEQREKLFEDTHSGLFGGHLRSVKIHSQLAKHFWWPTMRANIVKWCQA